MSPNPHGLITTMSCPVLLSNCPLPQYRLSAVLRSQPPTRVPFSKMRLGNSDALLYSRVVIPHELQTMISGLEIRVKWCTPMILSRPVLTDASYRQPPNQVSLGAVMSARK